MEFHKLIILIITLAFFINSISPTYASCKFPAIFNFGDSNSDTGAFAAVFSPRTPPYGQTFFHMPVGRDSDGRLIIDFIAESLNLPYLSAYLNSLGANFKHGANFASSVATIKLPPSVIPAGGYSPFYLQLQYEQFAQFKSRSQIIKEKGGLFGELMPEKDYFEKALYTFDIGQNEFDVGLFASNMSLEELNATVPDIVNTFSQQVKNIYNLGGRSFWIHNTGPFGCLPYVLTNFPSVEKDSSGCIKSFNQLSQYFNLKLKESVDKLRKDFPSAVFTYVDIYSVKYSLFSEPQKNGFELPLITCCGYGGAYNFSGGIRCGGNGTVNGREIVVDSSCDRPSVRVNWDGVHYTEAANKFVFDKISTGVFSDPPTPLNMACSK